MPNAAWHFSVRPPTGGERRAFVVVVAVYAAIAVAVLPWATLPGLVDPRIAAMAGAAMLVANLCTALLLGGWYLANGRPALLALAAGAAYGGAMAGLHVATFPGALFAQPLFGGEQTSAWLYLAWRAGGAVAYLAAVLLEATHAPSAAASRRVSRLWLACIAALGTAAAFGVLSTATGEAIAVAGTLWTAPTTAISWGSAAVCAVALGIILAKRAFDDALYYWLAVALVAALADLTLAIAGGGRYTLGWHLGRTSFVVSSYLLLAFAAGALAPRAQRRLLGSVAAYGGAIAAVLGAMLVRWLLVPWLGLAAPYGTMFGAIAVAVWLGGSRPAVVATLLGYLCINWLYIEPVGRFGLGDTSDMLQLGLFVVTSALIIGLGASMRRARDLYRSSEVELRDRAAQLQRADAHKSQFLAVLSHELRNPLAPLRSGLAILKHKPAESAADKTLAMMERQISHLTRLIDDLLDVSRIDRGKLDLRKERVALDAVARAAVETALPGIEAKQHELVVRYSSQSLFIDGDPVRLAQVIANLLNNAAKFTPADGRIELTLRAENGNAVISVKDSGIGIAHDALNDVFGMFVQLDVGREASGGGLGLGLTLVRSLVAQHGGRITAHSAGPGKGAEFVITLPLASVEPGAPAAAPTAPLDDTRRRILVVDDNTDAAETLAELLRLHGHAVEAAPDGHTALRAAEAFRPDVAFIDLNMPGMDGTELAQRLRATPWGHAIKLVALTGMGQEADIVHTRAVGFDEHLTKPADPKALARIAAGTTDDNVVPLWGSSA